MVCSSFARLLGERFPLFHQLAELLLGGFLLLINFAVALVVAARLFEALLDLGDGGLRVEISFSQMVSCRRACWAERFGFGFL